MVTTLKTVEFTLYHIRDNISVLVTVDGVWIAEAAIVGGIVLFAASETLYTYRVHCAIKQAIKEDTGGVE